MTKHLTFALILATSVVACDPPPVDSIEKARGCFAQDPTVQWMFGDAGVSPAGRNRQVAGGFELCSPADGYDPVSDGYHFVGQATSGDFNLIAQITQVSDRKRGEAGLAFALSPRSDTGAHVRVSATQSAPGEYQLVIALRESAYGEETVVATHPLAALPVTLRLRREGTVFHAERAGEASSWETLATYDAATKPLANTGVAMLTQASRTSTASTATFARASFEQTTFPPEPDCSDAVNALPGAPVTVFGRNFDDVTQVTVGGMAATVVTRTPTQLTALVPPALPPGLPYVVGVASPSHTRQLVTPVFISAAATTPPTGPTLSAIVDASGAARRSARAGDELYLDGTGWPVTAAASIWLGRVKLAVLPDSTSTRLHVRVGEVREAELGCPRVFVGASSVTGVRYGDTFGISAAVAPERCVMLETATTAPTAPTAATSPTAPTSTAPATVVLAVPRTIVTANPLQVSVLWSSPAATSASRGSRLVELTLEPVAATRPEERYGKTLTALASALSQRLNGTMTNGCACDVLVTVDEPAGTVILAPCVPVPMPDPDPGVPGSPIQLTPNHALSSQLDIAPSPTTPSLGAECADVTSYSDPRRWSWCQFMQVVQQVQVGPWAGYPAFEAYASLPKILEKKVYPYDDAPVAPEDVPVADKTVLLQPGMADRFISLGYSWGCEMAARMTYCEDAFESTWMPRFKTGDKIVKLFWVPEAQLASGMNKPALYSYVPPDGVRQYLVGMHIGVAKFTPYGDPDSYFDWITLWVPPAGDLPANYNTLCPTGNNLDKPAALAGSGWGQFVMCTEAGGWDSAPCGNPWGPKNECGENGVHGCKDCHSSSATWADSDRGLQLELGWISGLRIQQGSSISQCLTVIESGEQDYTGLAHCENSDRNMESDPFLD